MRAPALLLILVTSCFGQEIQFLNQKAEGKVARDADGNWIFADYSHGTVRVRKLSSDFSQTIFDLKTGGSPVENSLGSREGIAAIQVDSAGNSYVLGNTLSTDFPVSGNTVWASPPMGATGLFSFFLKVTGEGSLSSSTYLYSPGVGIQAQDFVAAPDGDWAVAGQAFGAGTIRAGGVELAAASGSLLLLRISPDGTVLHGGRRLDADIVSLAGIRADSTGNLFVAGSTGSDTFPVTPGAFQQKRLSGTCFGFGFFAPPYPCNTGFVMKFDGRDLRTVAATYIGGTRQSSLLGLAVDRQGAPYVTGYVDRFTHVDGDYPLTPGAFQTTYTDGNGFSLGVPFATKLAPDLGALAYSTFLAGSNGEKALSIAADEDGRAIVSGQTASLDFPATGAFQAQCGLKKSNSVVTGFVTRLTADGGAVESSAILDQGTTLFFGEAGAAVAAVGTDLVRVKLGAVDGPVAACTLNGGNFLRESFLGPRQLVTIKGGPFPEQTRLLFDGVVAPLLYVGSGQINAVVPQSIAGQTATLMEIEVDGVRSNARQFAVHSPNPTVKVWVAPDGSIDNRGNPLADVALSDGSQHTEDNPAHAGDVVTIFTTGLDMAQPITVMLNLNDQVPALAVRERPGSFGSVVGIDVRIPAGAGGMRVITIFNGSARTADNPGFIWVQ